MEASLVTHSEIVSFIWGVADLIRDTFKRGKYQIFSKNTAPRSSPPR